MVTIISLSLVAIAGLLSVPITVLLVEVIAALNAGDRPVEVPDAGASKRVALIVPAHNESIGIVPTIEDIRPQLNTGDRLIVIADNCSDDTAAIAAAAGAEVIVRNQPEKIGKGYALGWGIDHLSADPPDFVVFVDADCRLQSDSVVRLRDMCNEVQRPVQACFLMKAIENSPIDHRLAEFAFLLRNWIRPLGLWHLDCPVQLMGTGMIFPWKVIHSAPLASGNLVEDLSLGLDLAAMGKAPCFFPSVKVTSDFPMTDRGTDSQRQRWVQGHIGMIVKTVPGRLLLAITGRNLNLLVLTLDLLVPPLSLLGLFVVGIFFLATLAVLFGGSFVAVIIAAANLLVFALAVVLAWLKFGRDVLPVRAFSSIGDLISGRVRLYRRMLLGRTVAQWIRTDRGRPE
jgi:cellulose synthase/poly-beta-1,6-N-acetylglucosamine synthase-like glycosyltransferase